MRKGPSVFRVLLTVLWVVGVVLPLLAGSGSDEYDPLAVPAGSSGEVVDVTVQDAARNREIPLRFYLPQGFHQDRPGSAPVVLFSHGLGGTRQGCSYLGTHWASRGFVAVFLQHPSSDDQVWRSQRPGQRMAAMQQAASFQNLQLRIGDVTAVLDQLAVWNRTSGNPVSGRLDLSRIGMSGHSFGAHTAQAVSGQSFPLIGTRWVDSRIGAAVMFSPSPPKRGSPGSAFGAVKIPWLLMTGTLDAAVVGVSDPADRQLVYPALPPGKKYELVLHEGRHHAFTGETEYAARGGRNPNHHRAILAITTAFWDAFLCGSPAARAWLDGSGPRAVLETADRWQRK